MSMGGNPFLRDHVQQDPTPDAPWSQEARDVLVVAEQVADERDALRVERDELRTLLRRWLGSQPQEWKDTTLFWLANDTRAALEKKS